MGAKYFLSKVSHRALRGASPHEQGFGQTPSVSHLRPFGCVAYAWVSSEKRTKLDDVGRWCLLLGYATDKQAWRLHVPAARTALLARDVVFGETMPTSRGRQD